MQLNDGLIFGSGATKAGTLTVGSGSFSGVISDASKGGKLVKTGTGTFFVTGANTYTGGTVINGGDLAAGRRIYNGCLVRFRHRIGESPAALLL